MPKPLSVYIHVPFCIKKSKADGPDVCEASQSVRRNYLEALKREVDSSLEVLEGHELASIYIGGGASMLRPKGIADLVLKIKRAMILSKGPECTIRFLPETMLSQTFSDLNICSFNRLSVEALCFKQKDFDFLETSFNYANVEDGMNMSLLFKYPNVDIEIIYGLPNQTSKGLENVLCAYTNFPNVQHITLKRYIGDDAPGEDESFDQFKQAVSYLTSRNFTLYGTNRLARPHNECRFFYHQAIGVERIGFGASATTIMDGYSYQNTPDIERYINYAGDFEKIIVNPVKLEGMTELKRRAAQRLQFAEPFSIVDEGFSQLTDIFDDMEQDGLVLSEGEGIIKPTQYALFDTRLVQQKLLDS